MREPTRRNRQAVTPTDYGEVPSALSAESFVKVNPKDGSVFELQRRIFARGDWERSPESRSNEWDATAFGDHVVASRITF